MIAEREILFVDEETILPRDILAFTRFLKYYWKEVIKNVIFWLPS